MFIWKQGNLPKPDFTYKYTFPSNYICSEFNTETNVKSFLKCNYCQCFLKALRNVVSLRLPISRKLENISVSLSK